MFIVQWWLDFIVKKQTEHKPSWVQGINWTNGKTSKTFILNLISFQVPPNFGHRHFILHVISIIISFLLYTIFTYSHWNSHFIPVIVDAITSLLSRLNTCISIMSPYPSLSNKVILTLNTHFFTVICCCPFAVLQINYLTGLFIDYSYIDQV